jgi:membrane protein DedA with SNARE-associated domain
LPRPHPEAAPIPLRFLFVLAIALAGARGPVAAQPPARATPAVDTLAVADPVATGADVRTPAARAGAYLALSVGPILAEEIAPLGAGAAASQGELALWPAVLVMTLGGWVSTGLLYALGRWRGVWLRRRFPRAEATAEKLLGAVERRPWRSALAVRYAFGLRVLLPLACGAAHVRADVYALASLVSSATWSAAFALLGYWFGQAAITALRQVQAYDEYVAGVLAGAALVAWLVWRRRRRAPASPPAR